MERGDGPLDRFRPAVREWFRNAFPRPTPAQEKAWPPILDGRSTLLLAPTGSGKTLAAFLAAIDRLAFSPEPPRRDRLRVLYVSPLKALAFDVERNLRAPLAGVSAVAERTGEPHRLLDVAIRSGDTPASERARRLRAPPDILITTPESLYLLLTSRGREVLGSVETVIVDEIHAMVPSKRGSHLFLSLERLEALRPEGAGPLQRIGLSATQRPLDEVARLLGGGEVRGSRWIPRDVAVVDAGRKKSLEVRVEVPVEDLGRLGEADEPAAVPAASGRERPRAPPRPARSIWPFMIPRLIELIRGHRSTMVFVNSRRLAERLAGALNDAAGEEIALAHHGSVARDRRVEIEDRLKRGELPAIVATSSLELGVDMGAVDLVIQVESPPSISSGMQRIGRASHSVDAVSRGVVFPKHRGDLLACAAATARLRDCEVEELSYPRNPLDVLAQQIVAIASVEPIGTDALYALVRRAAPFAELPRSSFEGVLDMLSGRYPSAEFAELKPRIFWDRIRGTIRAREGARRIAVVNGGTIPDRGLYGVFLAGEGGGLRRQSRRVGELDEEMVFESREGDVFLLGASSWRIEEITHDRVTVSPAPGRPGKMPFWHGDRPGRPLEFGKAIGELARELTAAPREEALRRLRSRHGLDARAARNLLAFLDEQREATGDVPSDRTVVIERHLDEVGDWRVCLLAPFGARVLAPWATAAIARLGAERSADVDSMWSDDGFVLRLPGSDEPPDVSALLPSPEEVEDLVVKSLGGTALFASRFRENASRALLIPRRHPGRRSPLWAQRKRSRDLLAVASRHASFPILLETYRECLREAFDLPGLIGVLRDIESRRIRTTVVDTRAASPFASSLLFSWVANFIYDGDAPLAERRAQALTVDPVQLRELLGEAVLRELLDRDAIDALERSLQRLDRERLVEHADGLHDLLLAIGDLTEAEVRLRTSRAGDAERWIRELRADRRIASVRIAGQRRWVAVEDAARFRDALGAALPQGLPAALLEPVEDPLGDLVSRYARTHGPFTAEDVAARFGLGPAPVRAALERLAAADRVLEGEFRPEGRTLEWCDSEVLRALKRRSLAKLRKDVEPVEPRVLGRLLLEWQGIGSERRGADGAMSVVEQLQGCPLPASVLETEILPARIAGYSPSDLDLLCAGGEVTWRGIEPVGPSDGRIALWPAETYRRLAPPPGEPDSELARQVARILGARGAIFFGDLLAEVGGFGRDVVEALWELVWAGLVTNDTLAPLRSRLAATAGRRIRGRHRPGAPRLRRAGPPGSEGRWALLPAAGAKGGSPSETERQAAIARALLERHGVLTREAVASEGIPGGFSGVYPVLRALEESGRARRGYFVEGLGAAQFALPGAVDRLRGLRGEEAPAAVVLSAADPASPWGAALEWPSGEGVRPERRAGARVVLLDGSLIGYLARSERDLLTFLPSPEPERGAGARALARALAGLVERGRLPALLLSTIDGGDPASWPASAALLEAGFRPGRLGLLRRREAP